MQIFRDISQILPVKYGKCDGNCTVRQAVLYTEKFVFQDTCQGVANIVVSLAENHTKLILDCSLEQDETKKSNMIKLTHLVLVCIVMT